MSNRMNLVPYEARWLGDVTRLYHELAGLSPCCFPVAEATLAEALASDDEPAQRCLAVVDDVPVGWVHTTVRRLEGDDQPVGAIRCLAYQPGQRAAGQALLEAAAAFAHERGAAELTAFDPRARYPFWHLFCGALSDRAVHVLALLAHNGLKPVGGEVFLRWHTLRWPAPHEPLAADVELTLEMQPGSASRPGFHLRALRDGGQIGECICRSAAECAPGSAAEEIGFVKWLGVEEAERGRRLGRHLLSRALTELTTLGYRSAIISTSWTNTRAQLFYANFGACVIDWTYWLRGPAEPLGGR